MTINEENVNEIFNIENINNLSQDLSVAIPNLENDIKLIKATKKPLYWKDTSVYTYTSLVKKLWSLKDAAHSYMKGIIAGKYSKNKFPSVPLICQKILSTWSGNKGDIYHKLLELNSAIDDYNKRFPNNPLSHVDEFIGIEIRPSVKTEEINYFPY